MSKRAYVPERGDLVFVNFQPAAGREIDKRRPAIVISRQAYNRKSGLCVVIPISSDMTPDSLRIAMPAGLLPKPSIALCDYIRSVDYRERAAEFIAAVPADFLVEVTQMLLDVVDPLP